jgi:hypothetical protein
MKLAIGTRRVARQRLLRYDHALLETIGSGIDVCGHPGHLKGLGGRETAPLRGAADHSGGVNAPSSRTPSCDRRNPVCVR